LFPPPPLHRATSPAIHYSDDLGDSECTATPQLTTPLAIPGLTPGLQARRSWLVTPRKERDIGRHCGEAGLQTGRDAAAWPGLAEITHGQQSAAVVAAVALALFFSAVLLHYSFFSAPDQTGFCRAVVVNLPNAKCAAMLRRLIAEQWRWYARLGVLAALFGAPGISCNTMGAWRFASLFIVPPLTGCWRLEPIPPFVRNRWISDQQTGGATWAGVGARAPVVKACCRPCRLRSGRRLL